MGSPLSSTPERQGQIPAFEPIRAHLIRRRIFPRMAEHMIFATDPRIDETPKREQESDFDFLERSARAEIARVRDLVAVALERYPRHELDELVARIRVHDAHAFRSAMFELLLHEALCRAGYALETHPALPNGATTRPDFLVSDVTGANFYLEAVLASSRDGTSPAAEAIKAKTIDALTQFPHQNFYIEVDSEGDPTTQPSARALAHEIHAWLDSLEPEALDVIVHEQGFEAAPTFDWQHEAWRLTLRPIPVRPETRGGLRMLVGMHGGGAGIIDNWTPLRNALRKKGGRYGELDRPLVIAVNFSEFNLDPVDEMQALFGQEQYVEVVGRPDLGGRMERVPNSAWNGPHGPQGRRISGAWFFNDLNPYSVAMRRGSLYLNPHSLFAVADSMLRFANARAVDGRMVRADGISLANLFGLSQGWPEEG